MPETRNMKRPMEYDEVPYQDLLIKNKIGEGEFGSIMKGSLWGSDVAVKFLKDEYTVSGTLISTEEALEEFYHEVEVMRQLRHPNIVEFLGVCCQKPKLCMVFEYLPNGNLEDWMKKHFSPRDPIPLLWVMDIAIDIARGLNWMHHKGFIHRDLKSSNILCDKKHRVKIADFGLAHILNLKRLKNKSIRVEANGYWGDVGTAWYMAPEVLSDSRYGPKCDVYSLGVVFCELINGGHPYKQYNLPKKSSKFCNAVVSGLRPIIPKCCPSDFSKLIRWCWESSPSKRPTVDEVLVKLIKIHTRVRREYIEENSGDESNSDEIYSDESNSDEDDQESDDDEGDDDEGDDDEGDDEGDDEDDENHEIQILSGHLEQERSERQKLAKTFDTFKNRHIQLLSQKQREIENLKKQLKHYTCRNKKKRKHSVLQMLNISDPNCSPSIKKKNIKNNPWTKSVKSKPLKKKQSRSKNTPRTENIIGIRNLRIMRNTPKTPCLRSFPTRRYPR